MLSKEQIKRIRSLHRKKVRDDQQLFIIEGEKILSEAVQFCPQAVQTIYTTSPLSIDSSQFEIIQISKEDLSRISTLKQPQSVLTICKYFPNDRENSDFKIALDKVQDPGNMGTIIRLAAWFGIKEIIASYDTVDCYNPKVVQATMGALFNVQIRYVDLENYLTEFTSPIYGALLEGENIYSTNLNKKGLLLMGNEGNGIRKELMPFITNPVMIPKFGTGESLNVAMATGIFLSEFCRKEA